MSLTFFLSVFFKRGASLRAVFVPQTSSNEVPTRSLRASVAGVNPARFVSACLVRCDARGARRETGHSSEGR